VILGYHGSLYGDWLDWEALAEVANAFPEAAVTVIGDDKVDRIELPDNVHFLGLKAQIDLPAYVQRFDVGLIPFKVSLTTHAVSPLKVFEYLASGVPVAAPPLRALAGLDGVYMDYDLVPMVEQALAGPRPDRQSMLEAHSWSQRVEVICPSETRHEATAITSGARVLVRRVRHWSKDERLVGP
jgi:xanthosine utilization system XapX-like protein